MPGDPSMESSVQSLRRGSDPRAATCRGKLQSKRSKLNMEINKEMMLRSGAENLFKASTNKKMKETVALELSFVNSNLQLLKEQLAELNSSVELYQIQNKSEGVVPMIPLGLKETKEIELRESFKDFILEHYSEDGSLYEEELAELMDIRQAMRTPTRDNNGIQLLFEYYNQLYFVERRFFPPDRSLGIYFEWYDSLTGVPSCQRTVAFEKASVLFNIGGLYTQIGTRQERNTEDGLDCAVDNFLRAAGTFQYIHENFTNAPSMDLGPETLHMLVQLMCGQARECLFEKTELSLYENDIPNLLLCLELSQEAAHVSEVYSKVHNAISHPPVKDYVPYSWVCLTQVKTEHYKALSHYYVAVGLLDHPDDEDLDKKTRETMQFLHDIRGDTSRNAELVRPAIPETRNQQIYLGKAHLREALLLHEEALRINRMCRELRKKDILQEVLRLSHDRSLNKYADVDDEDDFQEVLDPPPIMPATSFQLTLAFPDFSQYKVLDMFRCLGPVAVFSAKHHWTAPRTIQLRKKEEEGYGFSVRGDAPVVVAGVEQHSLADIGGMREGDYLVAIGDQDVKWASHAEVVKHIKAAQNTLKIRLVTPLDRAAARSAFNEKMSRKNGLIVSNGLHCSISPTSTQSSSGSYSSPNSSVSGLGYGLDMSREGLELSPASSESSGSTREQWRAGGGKKAWNIFKKTSRDRKNMQDEFIEENVTFR